jgi:hypothetical protein
MYIFPHQLKLLSVRIVDKSLIMPESCRPAGGLHFVPLRQLFVYVSVTARLCTRTGRCRDESLASKFTTALAARLVNGAFLFSNDEGQDSLSTR